MKPSVFIILVNFNGYEDTIKCIESLKNINYANYDIVVVDNGSTVQPTNQQINYLKNNVILLEMKSNLGFSGGNNIGISYAKKHGAEFVLLLNNDTTVEKNFLSILVQTALSNADAGIVGGKIRYYSEPNKIWFGGGTYNFDNGFVNHQRMNELDENSSSKIKEITFMTGCLMLIPINVIDNIGLLDESFFLYAEDAEFSCRVLKKGYKIIYCEDSIIYHKVSSSTKAGSFNSQYYNVRNNLYVAKKYCNHIFKSYRTLGMFWIKLVLKRRMNLMPVLRGWLDYSRGITGSIK